MSEVKLNIKDSDSTIHGTMHGSDADRVIAALSAEPETIAELEAALERFNKRIDDRRPFASFHAGEDLEPWDAGLVIVDLAARLVGVESTYSSPHTEGEVRYHDGFQATDFCIPYRLHTDWMFVGSALEYEALFEKRRADRAANPAVDTRQVLYGRPMIEFIAEECLAARLRPTLSVEEPALEADAEDSVAEIHARWLMTPRADLSGHSETIPPAPATTEQHSRERSPRDVILEKLEFIDFDLQRRALQWSRLGEGPPPLARDSFAYRFAGFGTQEYVIYYDLLRHLLRACWQYVQSEEQIEAAAEVARLERLKEVWLAEPQEEFDGRIPSALIESERRRIPITLTPRDVMVDENCDLCRLMADEIGEGTGPAFWYLDGCNMDDGFEFSTHRTREEWEAEQREWEELHEKVDREWEAKRRDRGIDWELMFGEDDPSTQN